MITRLLIISTTQIHLSSGNVYHQGEAVKIRAKTFGLLKLLLASPGEIVTKQHILATVWDDVHTGDQVVFQSVKELRKLFAPTEVIKTHPRKGYAWIMPVTVIRSPIAARPPRSRWTTRPRRHQGNFLLSASKNAGCCGDSRPPCCCSSCWDC